MLQVFGNARTTQHRYHYAADSFPRESGNETILYHKNDCPCIDDPTSRNPFPIIDTLLSIPSPQFSTVGLDDTA